MPESSAIITSSSNLRNACSRILSEFDAARLKMFNQRRCGAVAKNCRKSFAKVAGIGSRRYNSRLTRSLSSIG